MLWSSWYFENFLAEKYSNSGRLVEPKMLIFIVHYAICVFEVRLATRWVWSAIKYFDFTLSLQAVQSCLLSWQRQKLFLKKKFEWVFQTQVSWVREQVFWPLCCAAHYYTIALYETSLLAPWLTVGVCTIKLYGEIYRKIWGKVWIS